MIWWNVRMNSLGRRPEAGRSLAEVDAYALKLMRDFSPVTSGDSGLEKSGKPAAPAGLLAGSWRIGSNPGAVPLHKGDQDRQEPANRRR